jgi:CheY-like chemotaxis protein/sporulation protein YlmC with PRC-barrel domain
LTRIGNEIEISIRDTGIGIDKRFLPYVFDRFRQADSTSTRKFGGLGLGLAIVRHMVELHGGSVSASSPGLGQGSLFTVRLPLALPASLQQAKTPALEPESSETSKRTKSENRLPLAGSRVLVVDDDSDTRDVLRFILDQYGASVVTAASTNEALDVLDHERPGVILSDLAMPGQDGYELIAKVRQREPERGGNIPAVALSAYARIEDRLRALDAGFQKHVSKPIDPDELVAIVASLALKNGEARLQEKCSAGLPAREKEVDMITGKNPRVLSSSTICSDRVKNAAGEDLGKIEDLMIDLDSGRIAYAVLSFGGFLKMGNKLFAVPWQALTVDTVQKVLVLNVDKTVLERAPGFDKENWPDMADPTFGRSIYKHYGYRPYWEDVA